MATKIPNLSWLPDLGPSGPTALSSLIVTSVQVPPVVPTIHVSALLEVESVTKGFLPPRMTSTQRDAIVTPATGLVVFNTTNGSLDYYDGASWTELVGSTPAAPVDATFVTLSTNATLTNERVLTGTANQIVVTDGGAGTTATLSTPQDIAAGSSPTFAGITLSGLTASTFVYSNASKAVTSTSAPTNGQLLIGSTGTIPAVAAITGTSNQIVVTNGAGTITLSTPQSIHTDADVTFDSLILDDLTANGAVYLGAVKEFVSAALTNGQLLVGRTGNTPVAATITGTTNQVTVTNGSGTITLSSPQDLHTTADVQFNSIVVAGVGVSGFTASSFVYSDASKNLVTTSAPTNGQLLVGSTGGVPVVAALTGTAGQITVTNGAGSITLSVPSPFTAPGDIQGSNLIVGGGAAVSELRFLENSGNGVNYVGFKAPAALGGDKIWELPAADGSSGQVLSTNGSAVLSWATASGSSASALATVYTPVGNVGGGTDDLMTYTVPGGTLSANGYTLEIIVWGTYAANGNSKTIQIMFGGAELSLRGTTTSGGSWYGHATIIRTGAATQSAQGFLMDSTSSGGYSTEDRRVTAPTETLSGDVIIKCTGAGTSNDDIVQRGLIVKLLHT